jgi:putative ABC transport system permease protein
VPEPVHGIRITHDYFALFGTSVQLDRTFTSQEDLLNIGSGYRPLQWLLEAEVGSDPQIIGTSISLGRAPYAIVGDLGPNPVSDMWLRQRVGPIVFITVPRSSE